MWQRHYYTDGTSARVYFTRGNSYYKRPMPYKPVREQHTQRSLTAKFNRRRKPAHTMKFIIQERAFYRWLEAGITFESFRYRNPRILEGRRLKAVGLR